jgi:hypothetical protein
MNLFWLLGSLRQFHPLLKIVPITGDTGQPQDINGRLRVDVGIGQAGYHFFGPVGTTLVVAA